MVGDLGLRHSLLLETGPGGRFGHLELATPAGLLTLHPEGDGTLHGNVIEVGGIRHVVGLAWDEAGVVDIEGSAIAAAACAQLLSAEVEAGGSSRRTILRVTVGLLITTGPGQVERVDHETWRVSGGTPFRAAADRLPVLPDARDLAARAGGVGTSRTRAILGIHTGTVDGLSTKFQTGPKRDQTRGKAVVAPAARPVWFVLPEGAAELKTSRRCLHRRRPVKGRKFLRAFCCPARAPERHTIRG